MLAETVVCRFWTGISIGQRARFDVLKYDWDDECVRRYSDAWPTEFLKRFKGVADALEYDPSAFSQFLFDQERIYFQGKEALAVRPVRRRPH